MLHYAKNKEVRVITLIFFVIFVLLWRTLGKNVVKICLECYNVY